jgi:hypothetical protein
MTRKLTGIAAAILAILTAELLHSIAHSWFHHHYHISSPYKSVAVSMIVAVAVFYPAFHFLEKYVHKASEKYVEGSKAISKNRTIGLILGFSIAVFFLFVGFSMVWHERNPLIEITHWFKKLY